MFSKKAESERQEELRRWEIEEEINRAARVERAAKAEREKQRLEQQGQEQLARAAETQRENDWLERNRQRREARMLESLEVQLIGQMRFAEITAAELCKLAITERELKAELQRERNVVRVAGTSGEESALYDIASELQECQERARLISRRLKTLRVRQLLCSGIVAEFAGCLANTAPCTERAEILRLGLPAARWIVDHDESGEDPTTETRRELAAEKQADAEARVRALLEAHGL